MRYNAAMIQPIKTYSLENLKELIRDLGQPSFRAKQLSEWLYLRHVSSYDDMTNLPQTLREQLFCDYPLFIPSIVDLQTSQDHTVKYVLEYHDGTRVETVAIPSPDGRLTVCCSTQVGCAMGCTFCATGKEGFTRNLSPGDIVDQILITQKQMGKRVSNVVMMGQGEPFLNYDHTLAALRILNNEELLKIGARHITISTCGVLPGIKRLSAEPEQFTLAISLHAATQYKRDHIMPGVKNYELTKLKTELLHYVDRTNRRITFEYAMMNGINDTEKDLQALIDFCAGLLCHINLIPLNKIEGSEFLPSTPSTMNHWYSTLNKNGIETTMRYSRGSDIAAACGQLKNALRSNSMFHVKQLNTAL